MPSYEETDLERKTRLAASSKERSRREFERSRKQDYKSRLKNAEGTAERREVKAEFAAAKDRGGIYDVSTDTYKQVPRNQDDQNSDTSEAGIDSIGGSDIPGGGDDGDDDGFELLEFDVVEGNAVVPYQWRAAAVTP